VRRGEELAGVGDGEADVRYWVEGEVGVGVWDEAGLMKRYR